jgi:hypothetical protein
MKKKCITKNFFLVLLIIVLSFFFSGYAFAQSDDEVKLEKITTCVISAAVDKQAATIEAEGFKQQYADGKVSFTPQEGWIKFTSCGIDFWVSPNK